MFQRRQPRPFLHTLIGFLWPRLGWQRTAIYYWHRLRRIPGSPESIAAGFACGAAASMTPLMGFHFLLSALLAFGVRGSILASAIGTVVGNPWTFPLIWMGTYKLGLWISGDDGDTHPKLNFTHMFSKFTSAVISADGSMFVEHVWPLWFPMLVGSMPVALIVGVGTYVLMVPPMRTFHNRRRGVLTNRNGRD